MFAVPKHIEIACGVPHMISNRHPTFDIHVQATSIFGRGGVQDVPVEKKGGGQVGRHVPRSKEHNIKKEL